MAQKKFEPVYLETYRQGLFPAKIEKAYKMLEECTICPRHCKVNRLKQELGFCQSGLLPEVSSYSPHFGEEKPLVGAHGSGTIFLTHCNLRCVFCQNYSISHLGEGSQISLERMARMMIELQKMGCHNINLVSPTHYVPQILKALLIAIEQDLHIPLVYNTGGYDSIPTLELLDGVIDIYMPDFKYSQSRVAEQYSKAPDYPKVAKLALKEMHRQVGDLILVEQGIARRGLLVRHLVLPQNLAGTEQIMDFLASQISKNTYVNIMDQYYPFGEIEAGSPLARRITHQEFEQALAAARQAGLTRLDKREKFRLIWRF